MHNKLINYEYNYKPVDRRLSLSLFLYRLLREISRKQLKRANNNRNKYDEYKSAADRMMKSVTIIVKFQKCQYHSVTI